MHATVLVMYVQWNAVYVWLVPFFLQLGRNWRREAQIDPLTHYWHLRQYMVLYTSTFTLIIVRRAASFLLSIISTGRHIWICMLYVCMTLVVGGVFSQKNPRNDLSWLKNLGTKVSCCQFKFKWVDPSELFSATGPCHICQNTQHATLNTQHSGL